MTPQEIFEFLRDNLSLDISEDYGRDYGGRHGMTNYRSFTVKLNCVNPETQKTEELSSQSFSIDLSD
jgi:hypothetical protein